MTVSMKKDLRKLLDCFERFEITRSKRHIRIRHPETGDFVIAPCSGSDVRGIQNLKRDLRLLSNGVGYNRRALQRRGLG